MIIVDTSVWIRALRKRESREASTLASLLDTDDVGLAIPVRCELLAGASTKDRPALQRVLSALPVLLPSDETWASIDACTERAARRGERFGFGDLLIAALAREAGALLWSLDTDFVRMQRLDFIELYDPEV